jgi:hypothetical protein
MTGGQIEDLTAFDGLDKTMPSLGRWLDLTPRVQAVGKPSVLVSTSPFMCDALGPHRSDDMASLQMFNVQTSPRLSISRRSGMPQVFPWHPARARKCPGRLSRLNLAGLGFKDRTDSGFDLRRQSFADFGGGPIKDRQEELL